MSKTEMLANLVILAMHFQFLEGVTIHRINENRSNEICYQRCLTHSCQEEAKFLEGNMDINVNPCNDFYKFACGNFIKNTILFDEASVVNTFSIAQTKISTEIFLKLIKPIKRNDLDAFKKTKIYYRNCMNSTLIEKEGNKTLFRILKKINNWPLLFPTEWKQDTFNWADMIFQFRDEKSPIFFPILIFVDIDSSNASKYGIKILAGHTPINIGFLLNGTENKLLKARYNFILKIASALGAENDERIQNEIRSLLNFELEFYKIKTPDNELLNSPETGRHMTIQMLLRQHPSIPWLSLINKAINISGINVNENESIYVMDLKYISQIEELLRNTPKRVLANYLVWRMIELTLIYMPFKLRNIAINYNNFIEGTKKSMTRESICLNEIMDIFPISLSAMFVRTHSNDSSEDISEMFQNIKNYMKNNLKELDWMDNKTRQAAIEKLDAMGVSVDHYNELLDDKLVNGYYRDLEINPGIYMDSAFNVTSFIEKQNYKNLRKFTNTSDWVSNRNAAYVNSYYILQKNIIEIPAGFLRSFYRADIPQYINYGKIGSIIGHEMIHAFDNQGRQYDKKGNRKNWWESSTEKKFMQKTKCIIEQYNNFTVPEVGLNVNGYMTQGENIADNGGFKAAYHAYVEWTKSKYVTENCLFKNLDYTPRQIFWISAASHWCSIQRPEYLKEIINTDEHSPFEARVILSLSNIKEFSEDFHCQIGSRMNPKHKCIIW